MKITPGKCYVYIIWWTCIFISLSGCGTSDERQPVSGVVTIDGQPVVKGMVVFEPIDGNKGPNAGAQITNGQFNLPRGPGGVIPGKYLLKVQVFRETGRKIENKGGQLQPEVKPVPIRETAGMPVVVEKNKTNHFEVSVHTAK